MWMKIKNTVEWCVVNQQSFRRRREHPDRGAGGGGDGGDGRARNKYFDDGVALMKKAP